MIERSRGFGISVASSRRIGEGPGRQGGRRWPARRGARASVLLAREEDDREEAVMGWAVGAGPVGWRQVSGWRSWAR